MIYGHVAGGASPSMEKESAEVGSWQQRRTVTADQEVWVRDRVKAAIKMALAVHRERKVGADEPLFEYSIHGLAEGAAVEIIRTLGMNLEHVSIRRLYGKQEPEKQG